VTLQMLWQMRPQLTLCLGLLVGACSTRQQEITPLDRDIAVETFDSAWRVVYETHFDTTFNGVDWLALRRELRPQAAAAGDVRDLRRVIQDMLDRLGQSHFALIPEEAADSLSPAGPANAVEVGDPGLDIRLVGSQVVVSRVDSGGAAEAAGVKPGWLVLAVEGDPVEQLLQAARNSPQHQPLGVRIWKQVMTRLAGSSGAVRRIVFLDSYDNEQELSLVLGPRAGIPVKFGNFPTFFARFESRRLQSNGISAGFIWFNNWMMPQVAQLDAAIDRFRELDGMIIDLRGNTGGLGAMVMGVAGHFYSERTTLGTMKTRQTELRYFANPRRTNTEGSPVNPYGGPAAILIDEMTASASEIFAGGMQTTGRVRVFGQTSMGAVLPAATEKLPNGDVLYHAIGDFTTAAGERLEGRGVLPDEPVPLTRAALLAGEDPCLTAALRWIAKQRGVRSVRVGAEEQRRME
jgi:carboxyl-terminal processing protease